MWKKGRYAPFFYKACVQDLDAYRQLNEHPIERSTVKSTSAFRDKS